MVYSNLSAFLWFWFPFCKLQGYNSFCFCPPPGGWGCLRDSLVQASWWKELVLAHWWVELDVVPLVGRTTSGGAFIEQLCVQEDFKQFIPACWLLSLRHPSTWVGPGLSEKTPPRGLTLVPPLSLSPQWTTAAPCLCRRPSSTGRYAGPSLLWGHCFFPLDLCILEILCAPSKSGVSISPSPVEFLWSNPDELQNQIFWGFLLPLPDPQVGKPDVGFRTFTPLGELQWYNYFLVCGLPAWCVWDLISSLLCPSYCLVLAFSLDVGYPFW